MLVPAEFERCLRRPALFRDGSFALHLNRSGPVSADGASWRLGLVVPKRYEASAVARNTIKRRWRDAFRRGRATWAAEFGSADLVVRLQAPLVPKPPKPTGRRGAPQPPATPSVPARVRARDRFDPVAILAAFVERLRRRGGGSASPVASRPVCAPS